MLSGTRRRLWIFAIIFFVGLGIATIVRTLLQQSRGPIAKNLREVDRKAVYPGGVVVADPTRIEGNGVVEPVSPETRLTTDVPGRIAAIYVKEGDDVPQGTLLAELDNSVQRAQIARAEAEIVASGAELQRVAHGMRAQDVNAVASEAVAAKARAALASSELARTQELVAKGSLGSAELDSAKRRTEAESAAANAAQSRAQGASAGGRFEDVQYAQARLKGSTAVLEEMRANLRRTQIIAPRAGRVLRLKLHVGEFHTPSIEPLMILGDVGRLRVRMDVDERDIARVKPDASAFVTAGAFGDQQFSGKVVEISRRMGRRTVRVDDPTDRVDVKVLEVLLELDGTPPLVTGMRVSATVSAK